MCACLSACSAFKPKVKCGVYRSETSDAYIEIFEGEMLIIHNYDLSGLEKILEDETISFAKLNESDAEDLRESWDLNRDYVDKKVKLQSEGSLINVAPTILDYMDIAIPKEMSESSSLIDGYEE